MTKDFRQIGFIGLGVMGEPVCRNLTTKSGRRVKVYDLDPAPVDRLTRLGAEAGGSMRDVVEGSDIVFLCLPSGEAVQKLAEAPDGLLAAIRRGQVVVDLSTSGVDTTRALVLSQVVLSFGIPFALVPLVIFTSRRDLMGDLVNRKLTTVVATIITGLIISLNIFLLYQTFFG